jgi:hypothetical protein
MQNGDRQCVLYELLSFCLLRRSVVLLMMWYKLRGRRSGSGASMVWGTVLKYTR